MRKLVPLLLAVISSTACTYNDLGPRATVFMITIAPPTNSFESVHDNWIVIRDGQTGELLDSKQITGNDPVELRSLKKLSGDKISVTHVAVGATAFWYPYFQANVYNGVDVGSNWIVAPPVSNKAVIKVGNNQATNFDKYLSIDFPKTTKVKAELIAYGKSGEQYNIYSARQWGNDEVDELRLGFFSDYSDYLLSISINDFSYRSRGPMPSSVNYTDFSDFKINDQSMLDYSLTTTKQYDYSTAFYSMAGNAGRMSYSINYFSPPGYAVHYDALTPELLAKYKVPVDEMIYHSTFIMLSGESYDDRLKALFDPEYEVPAAYQKAWLGNNLY